LEYDQARGIYEGFGYDMDFFNPVMDAAQKVGESFD
jgi:hypothetical protein